jgi:hypothetical protein
MVVSEKQHSVGEAGKKALVFLVSKSPLLSMSPHQLLWSTYVDLSSLKC